MFLRSSKRIPRRFRLKFIYKADVHASQMWTLHPAVYLFFVSSERNLEAGIKRERVLDEIQPETLTRKKNRAQTLAWLSWNAISVQIRCARDDHDNACYMISSESSSADVFSLSLQQTACYKKHIPSVQGIGKGRVWRGEFHFFIYTTVKCLIYRKLMYISCMKLEVTPNHTVISWYIYIFFLVVSPLISFERDVIWTFPSAYTQSKWHYAEIFSPPRRA